MGPPTRKQPKLTAKCFEQKKQGIGQGQGEAGEGEPAEWVSIAQVEADLASGVPAAL